MGKSGGDLPGMISRFRYPFFRRVSLVWFAESRGLLFAAEGLASEIRNAVVKISIF